MSKLRILVVAIGLMWVHLAAAAASPPVDIPVGFVPVQSRVFDGVAYDTRAQALWLFFDRGGAYCYRGVSSEQHRRFMQSVNKGRFFNTHIRDRYAYRKVGGLPMPVCGIEKPLNVTAR